MMMMMLLISHPRGTCVQQDTRTPATCKANTVRFELRTSWFENNKIINMMQYSIWKKLDCI